jgi:anti-sigma regulatory factor (Ser/Thr protein kinase)
MREGIVDPARIMKLDLVPELGEVRRLADAVEAFGERLGIPLPALYQVSLVLDELITNAVTYGIEPGESRPITVELSDAQDALTIELSDPGRPFDPRTVPKPDIDASLEDRKIGGLGVHLARTLMDSIDYRYDGARNHVTLVKRLAGQIQ